MQHIKPSILTSIEILPKYLKMKPGEPQKFIVKGIDQNRREISVHDMIWTATGGTIDSNGNYVAGNDEGEFEITVCIGAIRDFVNINIAKQEKQDIREPEKPELPGRLSWSGEVPPQKWMNFYTKVLSKFANKKGLKLTLKIEVAPEGGITASMIEETKTALRELGLDDSLMS